MTEPIANYQVIRDAMTMILSDRVDDETGETVLALLDEAIAAHADELVAEDAVVGESQVAVNETAVRDALDYLGGVREELRNSHTASTDRIDETIAHLQATVSSPDRSAY